MIIKNHIDGTEEFGYNPINRFEYSFHLYMNTVKRITSLYQCASVLDLKGYVAHFCYLRLRCFDTLIKVVAEHRDFISASCLLRMLGDNVAVFHLIYREPDIDLLFLRHALYVIDGCENNLKVLLEADFNKGTMPDDEFEESKKQIRFNREHRQRLMREAQEILDHSPLQRRDKSAYDRIVEDRNWKFKEFVNRKKEKNQYRWNELYDLIDECKFFDLLSYISQYAHGLSMSNLVLEMDEQNIHGIVTVAVGLLDRLHIYTKEFFAEEYQYILEGLLEPEMRDKILSYFDDQHRPDVEIWNQGVINKIKEAGMMTSNAS